MTLIIQEDLRETLKKVLTELFDEKEQLSSKEFFF